MFPVCPYTTPHQVRHSKIASPARLAPGPAGSEAPATKVRCWRRVESLISEPPAYPAVNVLKSFGVDTRPPDAQAPEAPNRELTSCSGPSGGTA